MMKQQLLKLSLLFVSLLTGVNGVWAEEEFTFVPTQWSCTSGSISTDGGKITCQTWNWGCTEIQNSTAFKVKTTGRYLVLTGTNIYDGPNNPCIKNFNGSDQDYKPKLTVNEAKTKAYIDMSGYYTGLTADGDYYTISSIGLFLQAEGSDTEGTYTTPTVITNIEFTAKAPVDPIDYTFDATKWTCSTGSISTEGGKITSSDYLWGCFELKNETAYKVKKSDAVYLKLTGEHIYKGKNNPCLNMLGDEIAAKPKLTVNSAGTMAYIDISGYTSALETDGDYYIVSGIQFFMEEPTETDGAATVITNIEFVASVPVDADPFTFVSTQWSCTSGSISTDGGKITCQTWNWGCTGILTETPFKVKKEGSVYLKLTGTNIYAGSSNPCLYKFNSTENLGWQPKLYVNSDNTNAYIDITNYLTDLDADTEGYVTISTLGLYLQEPTKTGDNYDAATIITNIEFVDAINITYPLEVGEAKAATLVLPFDAALPLGVKAYTLTYTGGTTVTATEVTELSANKPVLINADAGSYVFTSKAGTFAFSGEASNGALNGFYYTKTVPVDSYILKKTDKGVGFALVTSTSGTVKVNAHHAYLTATSSSPSSARSLDIDYGGTTGITQMEDVRSEEADVYYDLQGHRVLNPTKGLYIVKGKKVIVK